MILNYLNIILLWLSIIAYATLGGADFGGGIWYFFTFGKSQKSGQERQIIGSALGPVWEANNVWIIFLIVGLVTVFPLVAAVLATALFIPFSLALVGIVLRGASFAFQAHIPQSVTVRDAWGRLFSVASTFTPFLFGTCAAAVASSQIRVPHGNIPVALFAAWLTPFAIDVGVMALAICATLAAIYLCVEAQKTKQTQMAELFRARAFISGAAVAVSGILGLILMPFQAVDLWRGMVNNAIWALVVMFIIGLGTAVALFLRRYRVARMMMILETAAILGTWGLAQNPYLIPPDITVSNAASPPTTMWEFFISALVGMTVLLPSLWFLFHVFKGHIPAPPVHEKPVE